MSATDIEDPQSPPKIIQSAPTPPPYVPSSPLPSTDGRLLSAAPSTRNASPTPTPNTFAPTPEPHHHSDEEVTTPNSTLPSSASTPPVPPIPPTASDAPASPAPSVYSTISLDSTIRASSPPFQVASPAPTTGTDGAASPLPPGSPDHESPCSTVRQSIERTPGLTPSRDLDGSVSPTDEGSTVVTPTQEREMTTPRVVGEGGMIHEEFMA